ncbi:hypothetical protein GCM10010342_77340 [Streptomyces anulatus]|nr:hypothetical protein GCM10010342_77340 [Streptomyces anulatus]
MEEVTKAANLITRRQKRLIRTLRHAATLLCSGTEASVPLTRRLMAALEAEDASLRVEIRPEPAAPDES